MNTNTMSDSKEIKGMPFNSENPLPSSFNSSNYGQKGSHTRAGAQPTAFLNAIYESENETDEAFNTVKKRPKWNSFFMKSRNTPLSQQRTKSGSNDVIKSSVSQSLSTAITTTRYSSTAKSSATDSTTKTATSAPTFPSPATPPLSTILSTSSKSSHKTLQQNKLVSNRAHDNPAFSIEMSLPNKETESPRQPLKTSTLTTPKTTPSSKELKPTKFFNPPTNNKTTNPNKSIYSLAGKVPMSYNFTSNVSSHHQKLSSFSTSSLSSSSSTLKATSDYSTSSSLLSHSSSSPSLLSSSASSAAADSSSISSKLSSAKSPDDLWLSRVETALKSMTNDNTHVTSQQLKNALQVKESFVSDRFVQLFDKDTDGQIPVEELMEELRALVHGTQTGKLQFLFNVYNMKGNGHIVRNELQHFFTNLIEECKLQISSDNIQALTNAFFQDADRNRDGKITFDELQKMLQKRPSIVDNIAISPTGAQFSDDIKVRRRFRYFSKTYVQNNLKKIVTLLIFVVINLGLIAMGVILYWDRNAWIKVARSSGLALNFNCTLVLVLMLRRTLTWLRNTPLRKVLPFDQNVLFHRISGYFIAMLGICHTVGHIGNCVVSEDSSTGTVLEQLFTTRAGVGWVEGSAYITGDVLFVVLFIMVALSLPVIRRSGFFEVFYWSHKLYFVFWAVLIIHAPNFWMWFVVPGFIYILELITRQPCIRAFYMGKTYIQQVSLLPSDVTHLIISRPPGFHFKPGDYVFIQVPVIAKYEWHPFTISSAPENLEEIWLHIRTAGHWTRSLHKYFTDYTTTDVETGSDTSSNKDAFFKAFIKRRASSIAWLKTKPLKARKINSTMRKRVVTKNVKVLVHIDGPYGTPSRDIFEQEHAVLIGSGIGITPFASILQSIVSQYKASCVQCPRCSHRWCHQTPASVMTLKKVDFVWIIRDQRNFEWFTSLLCRLEREQEVEGGLGGIIDIHIYMTSVPPKTDMRGMGLQLALDLVHQDENTDLLTGLRTRTEAGRPDFEKLFSKIKDKSEGRRVKVFFCGSPLLGTTLKLYSHQYDFGFAHEYF